MARQALVQERQLALGQAAEHEVLPVGDADVGAQLALDRGQGPELGGGDVAEAGVGDGGHGALGDAADDVGVVPGLVRVVAAQRHRGALADRRGRDAEAETGGGVAVLQRRSRGCRPARWSDGDEELALLEDAGLELVPAHRVDEPLHAGSELVVAVAVVREHPEDRLERGEQVLAGRELLEGERRVRVGAEAAGHEHTEAGLAGAVVERAGGGDHADVVEHRLAAVGLAAGEVDLELAGQALGERVVEEVLEGGLGPRADVERLVGAGAGEVAAHHVADGVAAGLAGGEADGGHVAQDGGDLLEVDEVELHVLPGGEVAPAAAVGLGDVGEHVELLGGDRAVGHLHPHHLVVAALALAVDPVVQPEDPEGVLLEVAGEVAGQLLLELLDVGTDLGVDLTLQHGGPQCLGES